MIISSLFLLISAVKNRFCGILQPVFDLAVTQIPQRSCWYLSARCPKSSILHGPPCGRGGDRDLRMQWRRTSGPDFPAWNASGHSSDSVRVDTSRSTSRYILLVILSVEAGQRSRTGNAGLGEQALVPSASAREGIYCPVLRRAWISRRTSLRRRVSRPLRFRNSFE